MATDQELLQQAYERGQEAGRIEERIAGLERGQINTTETLASLASLINDTVTTVKLLKQDIEQRADSDKTERDAKARNLLNNSNRANIKWAPRMGWIAFISMGIALVSAAAAFTISVDASHNNLSTNSCIVKASCVNK